MGVRPRKAAPDVQVAWVMGGLPPARPLKKPFAGASNPIMAASPTHSKPFADTCLYRVALSGQKIYLRTILHIFVTSKGIQISVANAITPNYNTKSLYVL